jgi:hypothetical protein
LAWPKLSKAARHGFKAEWVRLPPHGLLT